MTLDSHVTAFGLGVQASEYLAGGKKAVRIGNTVHVSPAMLSLMKAAEPDELERLFGAIEVIDMGGECSVSQPIGAGILKGGFA